MSDEQTPAPGDKEIHPATRDLIWAICQDVWPKPATSVDFGICTIEHYEAIYQAFRHGEIANEELDAAIGNGPRLTELLSRAENNPHKGLVFETPWDHLTPEERHDLSKVEARLRNINQLRTKRMTRELEEERLCALDPERDFGPEQ